FYARCAAFHDACKEKEAWEVEERQALLLADKTTLAGAATEDLLENRDPATPRRRSVICALLADRC
ncbi:hypothetical protein, partial [Janthinobacterium sp. BJB304]|uniref:hypothetical protein n=1 Tax=Janthinobacterium sp. BJB304 TaxID=1572871 RepID=UPI001C5590A5